MEGGEWGNVESAGEVRGKVKVGASDHWQEFRVIGGGNEGDVDGGWQCVGREQKPLGNVVCFF